MALGDITRDMQSEPHSVRVACSRFASTKRRLHHTRPIALCNTGSVIDDPERPCALGSIEDYGDVASRPIVANRVLNHVADGLL